jgi:choline dehydrogenase-like flavoprotein
MLIDARFISTGRRFECDLCVVGAGFAGIAIVNRLRASGLSIVLLESGGFNPEVPTQELYCGEVHGDPYFRLDACRWRLFGGGGNRWGGWCRPLEAVDFLRRDWLAHSGWPIDARTLVPYEADAAKLFELPNARFDLEHWGARLPSPLALEGGNFQNTLFQHSPETNFGDKYRAQVLEAPRVTTIIHANLTQIRLNTNSQRVGELNVATLNRRSFTVHPKAVVLAAGGIENARLLLASRADRPAGLGNELDLVGRYFMEHLHVPLGHALMSTRAADRTFYGKTIFDDVRLRGVITPTPVAQDLHRLLAASIAVEGASFSFGTPFVGWSPAITFAPVRWYRTFQDTPFKWLAEGLRRVAQRAEGVPRRIRTWNVSRMARSGATDAVSSDRLYSLYFRSEQAPDPNNRVSLSERRDALEIPKSRLEWRVRPLDSASLTGWFEILDRDLRARGLGKLIAPPDGWERGIIGGPHHMGTTRMSADPRTGVVDADCRVHSVENLYVAGSSVFATSGYTNPTFALVTLALRLADTLRKRLNK